MELSFSESFEYNANIMRGMTVAQLSKGDILTKSSHKIDMSNLNNSTYKNAMVYLLQESLSGANICAFATESCKEV